MRKSYIATSAPFNTLFRLYSWSTNSATPKLKELHVEVTLLLNPDDDEDFEIIKCIKMLISGVLSKAEEITNRLSLLLKHDWQRAKWEAKPVWWFPLRANPNQVIVTGAF